MGISKGLPDGLKISETNEPEDNPAYDEQIETGLKSQNKTPLRLIKRS